MPFPQLTAMQWGLTGASALLVGLSKAGFGTGAGILAVPLMAAVLGPANMLSVMLLVLIAGDVFSIAHYVRDHDRRNLALLVPGMLAGVAAGAGLLHTLGTMRDSGLWMGRLIGAFSIAFVAVQLCRMVRERRRGTQDRPYRPRGWHGVAVGSLAGLTSTLAHQGGVLITFYLLPQRLEKNVYVGTSVKFFFITNLLKLIPYARERLMTGGNILLALLLLPSVVTGTFAGVWLNRKFSDRAFALAVYLLALAAGAYLLLG